MSKPTLLLLAFALVLLVAFVLVATDPWNVGNTTGIDSETSTQQRARDTLTLDPRAEEDATGSTSTTSVERSRNPNPDVLQVTPTRGHHLHVQLDAGDEALPERSIALALCTEAPRQERRQARQASTLYGSMWRGEDLTATQEPEGLRAAGEILRANTGTDGAVDLVRDDFPEALFVAVLDEELEQRAWTRYVLPYVPDDAKALVDVTLTVAVQRAASVHGQITSDAGTPLAGLHVLLRPEPTFDPEFGMRGLPPALRATRTDADGRYAFHGVSPHGAYLVRAGSGDAGDPHVASSAVFALPRGVQREIDLMANTGATLHGIVRDGEQRPIAGARVYFQPFDRGTGLLDGAWDPTGIEMDTDEEGRFQTQGLLPGERYSVSAEAPGFAPSTTQTIESDRDDAIVFELEPGYQLLGRVVDSKGAPVMASEVRLTRSLSQSTFMSSTSRLLVPRVVVTDADGTFRIEALEAGQFDLLATSADGTEAGERRGVRLKKSSDARQLVEIALAPLGVLEGRVIDADDHPIERFRIQLDVAIVQGFLPATMALQSFASSDGSFRLAGLRPGKYTLTVTARGRVPHRHGQVEVTENGPPIEIALPPAGSVRGVVQLETGVPVANATVLVLKDPMTEIREVMAGLQIETTTDADGRFELLGLPVGELTLEARHDTYL